MRSLFFLILLFLCLFGKVAPAQLLETRITVNYKQVRLAKVLATIKSQYGVGFSYANNLIPLDKKVNLMVTDKPLGQALNELFRETGIGYTVINGQVVLKKGPDKPKKQPPAPKPAKTPETGANNQEIPMRNEVASIETASLLPIPVLYDQTDDGQPKDAEVLRKEFETEQRNLQKNYLAQMDVALDNGDSSMASELKKDFKRLTSNLKKEFKGMVSKAKQIQWNGFMKRITSKDSGSVSPQTSSAQFSVFPPVSSNGRENARTINRFSLNLFAGYSGGLNGFEAGTLANIEKGNVKGLQMVGLANLAGGNVNGTQFAGLINSNKGHLEGVQFAGVINASASDSSNAAQFAGAVNIHGGDLLGTQFAGVLNVNNGYIIGPQFAGAMNINNGPVSGGQAAGFMNIANGNVKGFQAAGFMNIVTKNVMATQVAGFINLAPKSISGVQIAGFMNVGKKVKGSQIGVFNIADSISGVQFGLFNFARNGYRRFEVFGAERIQANMALRMGVRKFHNIFTVGINPTEKQPYWSYGFGFGSERELGKKLLLNVDLVCNEIHKDFKTWNQDLNLLNQLKLSLGVKPGKRTAIYAGPVINVAVVRTPKDVIAANVPDIIPDWASYDKTNQKIRVAIWAGFNAGIRF